mgnify:CR=1 FL=1
MWYNQDMEKIKKYRAPSKQKFLILLQSGLAFSFSRASRKYLFELKNVPKELRSLDQHYLQRMIREFEKDRLLDFREQDDGTVRIVLNERGKSRALIYHIERIGIQKPKQWDGKWRMVIFDIPEKKKRARDALREKLKELGFQELQHSVHIVPYNCKDEIDFLVEFFELHPCVYYVEVETLSNEARWIARFHLQ